MPSTHQAGCAIDAAMRIALFTFGVFRKPAEHPANDGFHDRNDPALAQVESSAGFIARSGYADEPGPESWGEQVFPRFYRERGDGWCPETLSLWTDVESIVAFAYEGIHGDAVRHGRDWFVKGPWPPLAMWWVADNEVPDWTEAVRRFEHLADHGASAHAFGFARTFGSDGQHARLDRALIGRRRTQNAA